MKLQAIFFTKVKNDNPKSLSQ